MSEIVRADFIGIVRIDVAMDNREVGVDQREASLVFTGEQWAYFDR
jgi:hypothetical protein